MYRKYKNSVNTDLKKDINLPQCTLMCSEAKLPVSKNEISPLVRVESGRGTENRLEFEERRQQVCLIMTRWKWLGSVSLHRSTGSLGGETWEAGGGQDAWRGGRW